MADQFSSKPVDAANVERLWALMSEETPQYLEGFTPFRAFSDFQAEVRAARKDLYRCLLLEGTPAGFFMLRGLDAGFERPSYGVYVSSRAAGRGLGHYALDSALKICRDQEIDAVFLKVFPRNEVARRIYEGAGFETIGICPDTAHIMMERKLVQ